MRILKTLLILAVCLCGCQQRQHNLMFSVPGPQGRQSERHLVIVEPGSYRLKDPVSIAESGLSFAVAYRGGGEGQTIRVLGSDGRKIADRTLPRGAGNLVKLYLPLSRGSEVQAFTIEPASVSVLEAGITPSFAGLELDSGVLHVGTLIRDFELRGNTIEVAFEQGYGPLEEKATEPAAAAWQLELELQTSAPFSFADFRQRESAAAAATAANAETFDELSPSPMPDRVHCLLTFAADHTRTAFRHSAFAGLQKISIYRGLLGFRPESLSISPLAGSALLLKRIELTRLPQPDDKSLQPLAADPGAVLIYDPDAWRQREYELFSWSRLPGILILDTASYEVQSRFFKRVAFFVEKQGFRGRLLRNEEFAGLHGFNAHDYRAEDLARFFREAEAQGFPLNPEEKLLEEILIYNGVLRFEEEIVAGRGGILSISRSSYPLLRRHLLTHECFHGVFFSLPEYREACFQAWERLSAEEKEYWKLFFDWMNYDTEDRYLVVNEYQAYLFQQPLSEVRSYLGGVTASRLIASYPQKEQSIRRFLAEDPDSFERSYRNLALRLAELASLEGGRVVELVPADAAAGEVKK